MNMIAIFIKIPASFRISSITYPCGPDWYILSFHYRNWFAFTPQFESCRSEYRCTSLILVSLGVLNSKSGAHGSMPKMTPRLPSVPYQCRDYMSAAAAAHQVRGCTKQCRFSASGQWSQLVCCREGGGRGYIHSCMVDVPPETICLAVVRSCSGQAAEQAQAHTSDAGRN